MDAFSLTVLLQRLGVSIFGIHLLSVLWLGIALSLIYILCVFLIYQFYVSFMIVLYA